MKQIKKCVMLLNETIPLGLIANTAAILGISLGKTMPEIVGEQVVDYSGNIHEGIITTPIPILKGNVQQIKAIRMKLYEPAFHEVHIIDFSDLAQNCKSYDEYIEKMKEHKTFDLQYLGVALCGPKKKINQLTGSMPLLK